MSNAHRSRRGGRESDAGTAEPVALAILAIPMLAIIGVVVIGGRLAVASDSVATAAGAAARDASLARTPNAATRTAITATISTLRDQHLQCRGGPTVRVDVQGFSAPSAMPAVVAVDVHCVVSLADVALPGLPGAHTIHFRAVSPLDPYRSTP